MTKTWQSKAASSGAWTSSDYPALMQTEINELRAELDAHKNQEPIRWWNGIRKHDDRDLAGPSFSEVETPRHDIPLIAGWNPVHLAAGAQGHTRDQIGLQLDDRREGLGAHHVYCRVVTEDV